MEVIHVAYFRRSFRRYAREGGVKKVFDLNGDLLNPLGDTVRKNNTNWVGVRDEEGVGRRRPNQPTSRNRAGVCLNPPGD